MTHSRRRRPVLAIAAVIVMVAGFAKQSAPTFADRAAHLTSFDIVWDTVNDTFPDPAFGGLDWNAVRRELRPRAEQAVSADGVRSVITEMLARLKRSHFVLLSGEGVGDAAPVGAAI